MTSFPNFVVGQDFASVTFGAVTRAQLALFAGGSSDHNPMHIDLDFARSGGMDDVFAHGMLVMALLGRAVTTWVPQGSLSAFSARFVAITQVGDVLTARAKVAAVSHDIVDLDIGIANAEGVPRLVGIAKINIPQ